MAVKVSIHPLPVLVTDADVNKLNPPKDEPDDWEVEFGDSSDDGNEFPFCCAIGVLGGAMVTDGDGGEDAITPKHREAYKEALEGALHSRRGSGLVLYTLTDGQAVEREVLLECGFQVMAVFKNPHSNNRVTLYGRLQNQPRDKPVAAKKKKVRR